MAILTQQSTGSGTFQSYDITTLAPAGAFPARLVDIMETFGVERTKYQSTEIEVVDVCRFLFAVNDENGKAWLVQTKEMAQKTNEKSNLMKFLKSLKGKEPPVDGTYDFCTEIGSVAQVTIEHKTSKSGKVYGQVAGVAPLMAAAADQAPGMNDVEIPGGARTQTTTATTTVDTGAATESTAETDKDPF